MNSQDQRREWARLIQSKRKKHNLSQEDLARQSDRSLSYIQKIENAVRGNQDIVDELLSVMKKNGRRKAS